MTTATSTATLRRMYIDGKWCDADNGRTLGVINPATEDAIAEVAYGGRAETRRDRVHAKTSGLSGPSSPSSSESFPAPLNSSTPVFSGFHPILRGVPCRNKRESP